MRSVYIKVFAAALVIAIVLLAAYKSDKRIENKTVQSISYTEQNTKFITMSNGLECIVYRGQRVEAGISCNWDKFNSTNQVPVVERTVDQ